MNKTFLFILSLLVIRVNMGVAESIVKKMIEKGQKVEKEKIENEAIAKRKELCFGIIPSASSLAIIVAPWLL